MVLALGVQSARRRALAAPWPCWARTPRPTSVRWSLRRGRPCRTAFLVLSPCATCSSMPRRPPNRDVVVRAARHPWAAIGPRASPPPYRAHTLTCVTVVTSSPRYYGYKSVGARRPRARDIDAQRRRGSLWRARGELPVPARFPGHPNL
jgi:hypothetical protein